MAAADAGMSVSFPWICLEPGGAAPEAIPPVQHLPGGLLTPSLLTWQTGAYGCLLMLCCSYGLSGLMVCRGSGGFAWGEGREGPGKGGLHPWEVERYQGLCGVSQQ